MVLSSGWSLVEQENPGSISALHKCVFLFGNEVCRKWSGLNQHTRIEIKFNLVVLPGVAYLEYLYYSRDSYRLK